MKRILMVTLLLILSVTSICYAEFKNPNPDRWITVSADDMHGCWYDKETIKFIRETKSYSPCHHHKIVRCWVMMYDAENEKFPVMKLYTDFDLNCRTTKENHIMAYDKNYKQLASLDVSFKSPEPIVPDSIGEYLISIFESEWEKHNKK